VRLKLDKNLGRHAAELLRRAGHDVSTVALREARGQQRAPVDSSSAHTQDMPR